MDTDGGGVVFVNCLSTVGGPAIAIGAAIGTARAAGAAGARELLQLLMK